MPEKEIKVLKFTVIEVGQWAYLLWPWGSPSGFIYAALTWGAEYNMVRPMAMTKQRWIEFRPANEKCAGECDRGLYFGMLRSGAWHLYRRFNARQSHSLTQHGLDMLPQRLVEAATECGPGLMVRPNFRVQFAFRIETRAKGAFDMTFHDWTSYFVSGRNGHISDMAISYGS